MKLAQNHLIGLFIFIYCVLEAVESFAGWVDPDTPNDKKKTRSKTDGQEYELIMSDEFNRDGRHFHDGFDPMWTGIQRSDDDQTSQGRKSLQYYNSSYIKTENGSLVITTTTEDTKWRGWNPYLKKYDTMTRHFRSGMVQTWNKFCYTGGILELSVKFPGRHDVGGLWPAAWLMGNLGRATFEASTNLMWPWSYEKCNRELQHAQEISGCDVTEHYNMKPGRGRGATEIDVIEVMPGPSSSLPLVKNHVTRPYCSMTLQVSYFVPEIVQKSNSWTVVACTRYSCE
jgi:beta-glucanase (GH16 family)